MDISTNRIVRHDEEVGILKTFLEIFQQILSIIVDCREKPLVPVEAVVILIETDRGSRRLAIFFETRVKCQVIWANFRLADDFREIHFSNGISAIRPVGIGKIQQFTEIFLP